MRCPYRGSVVAMVVAMALALGGCTYHPELGMYVADWVENDREAVTTEEARARFLASQDGQSAAFETLRTGRFTAEIPEDEVRNIERVLRSGPAYPGDSSIASLPCDLREYKATDHWKLAVRDNCNDCEDFVLAALTRLVDAGYDPGAIGLAEITVIGLRERLQIGRETHRPNAAMRAYHDGSGTFDYRTAPQAVKPFRHALVVLNVRQRDGRLTTLYADFRDAWFVQSFEDKPGWVVDRIPAVAAAR
ncbi:MAG: hypothetical protein ACU85V_00105 [Gammaproteobacteria bacterium]